MMGFSSFFAFVNRSDKLRKIFHPFRIQRIGKEVLNVIPLFFIQNIIVWEESICSLHDRAVGYLTIAYRSKK